MRVRLGDLTVSAERTVIQYASTDLETLLEDGSSPEEFFDYQAEWEDEEQQDFEYNIEIEGVVSSELHSRLIKSSRLLEEKIVEMEKRIEHLLKKELDLDGALDRTKKEEEE